MLRSVFSSFSMSLGGSAKSSAASLTVAFLGGSSLSSPALSFPLASPATLALVPRTSRQSVLRNHLQMLLRFIFIHTQLEVVSLLNHSLVDFCNVLILGNPLMSFTNLSSVFFQMPFGDITLGPIKVLDVVIDVVILPGLHYCLLSCNSIPGKGSAHSRPHSRRMSRSIINKQKS